MKEPFFSLFLSLIAFAGADDIADVYSSDPYLAYRPAFVRSLPVQIMLTGVVLTLVAVLFIHLLFTAKYHWSLAPVNYVLQISAVTTLLISLTATIHVVLSASFAESEKWPYMLSYIAVNVPPLDLDITAQGWSIAERATWLVMSASTAGLIQITHIQFLTLLYPSRLEGRLIFALLGPLAIVAATMQLLLINSGNSLQITATAVRNVCNATLSLLFTTSLFIWGLLVNRKQAWRTDGGTAVFGCGALSLALVSTALNFLYVHKEDEFVWLPGLMWAVVLWQSFLGWWWWVGAGSGSGFATEDENRAEKLRREAKRALRKREARERKKEKQVKVQKVWQGVTTAFSPTQSMDRSSSQVRSRTSSVAPHISSAKQASSTSMADTLVASDSCPPAPSISSSDLSCPRTLPRVVYRWYLSLRHAHVTAAREQAAERVERIEQLGRDLDRQHPWGWGGVGWRRKVRGTPSIEMDENVGTTRYEYEGEEDGESDGENNNKMRNYPESRTDHDCQDASPSHKLPQEQSNVPLPLPTATVRPSSVWWWGPLRRWRLQDSTVY